MLAMLSPERFIHAETAVFKLPDNLKPGSYLSAALDGVHGIEGAYCAITADGRMIGASDRAPSYPVNMWEHICAPTDRNYTYYFPLEACMAGGEITVSALYLNDETPLNVWLCDGNTQRDGVTVMINVPETPRKTTKNSRKAK